MSITLKISSCVSITPKIPQYISPCVSITLIGFLCVNIAPNISLWVNITLIILMCEHHAKDFLICDHYAKDFRVCDVTTVAKLRLKPMKIKKNPFPKPNVNDYTKTTKYKFGRWYLSLVCWERRVSFPKPRQPDIPENEVSNWLLTVMTGRLNILLTVIDCAVVTFYYSFC